MEQGAVLFPYGVAVDSGGNVYVADTGNNAIRKITPAGMVTTLAGTPRPCNPDNNHLASADGMGRAAKFVSPIGLAVDSAGNVYVADENSYKVRKVTSAGEV